MTWLGVAVGLLSAAVFGVAAVAQAQAVRGFETTPDGLYGFVARSIRDVRTMLVVAAYLVGFVLHATAIWLLPLYLAQALVAMSLPVTALASGRVRGRAAPHRLARGRRRHCSGSCCSRSAPAPRARSRRPPASWSRSGSASPPSGRRPSSAATWPAPLLGLLAGLGYAGSAISVRGIGTPVDGIVVAAALAVPVVQPRGLLAVLTRHAPRSRPVDHGRADRGPDLRACRGRRRPARRRRPRGLVAGGVGRAGALDDRRRGARAVRSRASPARR